LLLRRILGHQRQIDILGRAVNNNKVPHAYLFSGLAGIGKKLVAMRLAKSLQCEAKDNKPCDRCLPCKKVEDGNHPDISVVEADGQFIKVEQIRQLQKKLGYKPFEGKATVCVIDGADKLNISAANSLLKTLEEPPAQTHLILIAENIRMVIPTILSRCQRINFSPLPAEEVEEILKKDESLASEDIKADIKTVAAMSGGSPGKALDMAGTFPLDEKDLLLKEFSRIDSAEKAFLVAEKLVAKEQIDRLMEKLELLKFFMRDVMLTKLGRSNKVVNTSQSNIIVKRADQLTIKEIISKLEIISEAEKSIIMNANKRLAVETMLLKLFKESGSLC